MQNLNGAQPGTYERRLFDFEISNIKIGFDKKVLCTFPNQCWMKLKSDNVLEARIAETILTGNSFLV